jgi:DNA polymerase
MPVLFRDFETRSCAVLKETGSSKYARDPSTEILCCGYAIDNGPIQLWTPDQPCPPEFEEAARDPDWLVVAFGDHFERAIERHIMAPRFNWPLVPIERHRCLQAAAAARALPQELSKLAKALNLEHRKDDSGHKTMLRMSKPRRPRKGEDPAGTYWHDGPDLRDQLHAYCRADIATERDVYRRIGFLSPELQAEWIIDAVINDRGFHADTALATAAIKLIDIESDRIAADVAKLTDGEITSVSQVGRIKEFLERNGHKVQGIGKRSVSAVLAHDPGDDVRALLELRQAGGAAAANKAATLLESVDDDGRVRGTLRFHGTHTGRWSGSRFQPQNLKKVEIEDIEGAIAAVMTGDVDRLRRQGGVLGVIGDLSRSMVCAPPGHVLIGADLSAIESRVLAWIAGEKWKIENYREFDRTGDPNLEPYCQTASRILNRPVTSDNKADRDLGKVADLALGYGGSIGAWRRFRPDDERTDAQITAIVAKWRRSHVAIGKFWVSLELTLKRAIVTGSFRPLGSLAAEFTDGTLYVILPSGRRLAYPQAHIVPGKFPDKTAIAFMTNDQGKWVEEIAWYGTFAENAVSAIARDLLAAALVRLEAAGCPVVLHCHDEIVAEVPEGNADESAAEFMRLVLELPSWAAGLPIAAKPWSGRRYTKSNSSPEPPMNDIPDDINEATAAETNVIDLFPTGDKPDSPPPPDDPPEPPPQASKPNGADHGARGKYDRDPDEGKPYAPIRDRLLQRGYTLAKSSPYLVPGSTEPLYCEDRFELKPGIAPSADRPSKEPRYRHRSNGVDLSGIGPRPIVYNWQAIMGAGPGSWVFVTEGPTKCDPLNAAGLIATAVAYHSWKSAECAPALAGRHVAYLEDHDLPGENGRIAAKDFSAHAQKHIVPVAASFRIVPGMHLWKHLGRTGEPPHGWDVKNWLKEGGDPTKLLDICRKIDDSRPAMPFIDMSNWDWEPVPEQPYTVPDRVPLHEVAMFYGEGAAGKSTICLHLCAAHVLGRDWLGVAPAQGPAVFIDAEDGDIPIHRRLAAIREHYGVTFDDMIKAGLHLVSLAGRDAVLATASRSGKIEPTSLYKELMDIAGDLRPKMITIASLANVYAGSEIDRSQVQQFTSLLTRVAQTAGGSVTQIAHPSLAGINTGTGLSGSTQWHNAVRARFYLKTSKPEGGEPPDNDLREIEFKKNNYGQISGRIVLRYQNGMFLPEPGMECLDQASKAAAAQEVFLALLKRFNAENRNVSSSVGKNYAPPMFAREDEAREVGLAKGNLETAMRQLFRTGKIWNEPQGKPSRPSYRIAVK